MRSNQRSASVSHRHRSVRWTVAFVATLFVIIPTGCGGSSGPKMPDDFDPSKYQFEAEGGSKATKHRVVRSSDGEGLEGPDTP